MLAGVQPGVEQRPQLGPLGLGLPLAEAVAVAEDALLGTRLFLVAARAADQRVKAQLLDRLQQRDGLMRVARLVGACQTHGAARHRVFDAAHDQLGAQFFGALVAEVRHLGKVVARVDHEQRKRDAANAEGFLGAAQHHQRILATRKQQGRALEGGGHFAQDEDGFFLQRVEVAVAERGQCLGVDSGVHSFFRLLWVLLPRPLGGEGGGEGVSGAAPKRGFTLTPTLSRQRERGL